MPRTTSTRREYAERLSGFHAGQRIKMSPAGQKALCHTQSRRQPDETGTIVSVVTANRGIVIWDQDKSPQGVALKYLAPASAH